MRKSTIFCNHYRAMSEHTTCAAGIAYETFKGIPFDKRPCFDRRDGAERLSCGKLEMPTPEQVAQEEAEIEARIKHLGEARKAIVESLGGPWKRGMPGSQGVVDCPVCKGEKTLHFSRAGYNGHIHARCKTSECVSWME